jgi:lipopolysaccharide transport system permease protein
MWKSLGELWEYRQLVWVLVLRDIKARYKHTTVGIAWAVIQPLFLMFVFTLVFSRFFNVSTGGVPYPVFSYVALLPWTFISRVMAASGSQFIGSRGLITKIYFPREVIPMSSVLSALVDFGFGVLVLVLMMIYYQIGLTSSLWWVIVILPTQLLLALGLAFFSSATMALFRDLQFAMPLLTQLWMYASPVIYSVRNLQPEYKVWFYLNPLTGIVDGYRDCVVGGRVPDLGYLTASVVMAVLAFVVGYWLFKKVEYFVVDIM